MKEDVTSCTTEVAISVAHVMLFVCCALRWNLDSILERFSGSSHKLEGKFDDQSC